MNIKEKREEMNRINLMGRLTREPELRYSSAQDPLAVTRYTLAVDRKISREKRDRGEQGADFINCVAFGKSAEFVEKYFRKGQMVGVTGSLRIQTYTDTSGQSKLSVEVITDDHHFGGGNVNIQPKEGVQSTE